MTEWQPIETAPRDERWLLLLRDETNDMLVALWDDEQETYKWQTLDGNYHADWPTHWMPLPEPPK